jgi:hypothetical protein
MAPQWIKLSFGWLDLGHVAQVVDDPTGNLALHEAITPSGGTIRYLTSEDAEAVRAYLDKEAVNRPVPPAGVRRAPSSGNR